MLFDMENSGFRLKKLELFNWGTFTGKVWEMNPDCKTSLLTGANGSGKTTMVDAITTLLIPPVTRHYNQSSGSEKKKERTELSYALGAYGNISDDESLRVKIQYLRDRDTISILTAIFFDSAANKYVTIGQIRYFTKTAMARVYFVSGNELSLNDDILPFDNRGMYKKRLSTLDTRFFDTFTGYSASFMKYLGLKSEKALNLFSQTVGVKVLGDINEFIRKHMLEEGSAYNKFEGVYENFQHLLDTQLLIERAEKEIELLKKVGDAGLGFRKYSDELDTISEQIDLFPYFRSEKMVGHLKEEQKKNSDDLIETNRSIIDVKKRLSDIRSNISEYQIALNSNQSAGQLKNIEKDIKYKKEYITDRKKKWEQYKYFLKDFDLVVPDKKNIFSKQSTSLEKISSGEIIRGKESENRLFSLKTDLMERTQLRGELKVEFDSLLNRDNNIPLPNISIRDKIAKELGINIESLPFVGECLMVKDEDSDWEMAIEKVLYSFALCILVDGTNYKKVNKYINSHNLRGKVVYFRVNTDTEYFFRGEVNKDSLVNKVQIKFNTPFKEWIEDRLVNRYNYICTNDLEEFQRLDFALTSQGLMKNKNRHEKDDRRARRSVLGWDNLKKRALLEREIKALGANIDKIDNNLQEEETIKKDILKKINSVEALLRFTFEDIDFFTLENELLKLNSDYDAILNDSRELKAIQTKISELNQEEVIYTEDEGRLLKESGVLESRIDSNSNEISRETENMNSFTNINSDCIDILNKNFTEFWNGEIDRISGFKDKLFQDSKKVQNRREIESGKLISAMGAFVNPGKAILEKYPSWMDDTRDLKQDIDYLNDFNELYKRVLKNDLPNHKKSFRQFLNKRVMEDMIGLNHTLDNELKTIQESIRELNYSLKGIRYQDNPGTYITLRTEVSRDLLIKEFRQELKNTFADAFKIAGGDFSEMEFFFKKSKKLLNSLKDDEYRRKKVLDVRNWLIFTAEERYLEDKTLKQVYQNSESLSGGEKAKLAYTILASAIVYQFGIQDKKGASFRFVVVDEAFSKADIKNSKYLMDLFKKLDLQLIVITPLDSINLVEEYISTIHFVQKSQDNRTMILNMSIREFQDRKEDLKVDNIGRD